MSDPTEATRERLVVVAWAALDASQPMNESDALETVIVAVRNKILADVAGALRTMPKGPDYMHIAGVEDALEVVRRLRRAAF